MDDAFKEGGAVRARAGFDIHQKRATTSRGSWRENERTASSLGNNMPARFQLSQRLPDGVSLDPELLHQDSLRGELLSHGYLTEKDSVLDLFGDLLILKLSSRTRHDLVQILYQKN